MRLLLLEGTAPVVAPTSFEADLVAYLNSMGFVVTPDHVPQSSSLPASMYTMIDGEPKYTLRQAAGLDTREFRFSFLSTSKMDVLNLEIGLRGVLLNYTGTMGQHYVSSTRITDIFDVPYEANVDASDTGTFCRAVDYRFLFRESIPTF